MGNRKPKALLIPETSMGVCLWDMGNKQFLSDGNGFLSLEGVVGDIRVEEKMRKAAHYWLGEAKGKPHWITGARKVSDDEYYEQLDRLKAGMIPDPVDELRQAEINRRRR